MNTLAAPIVFDYLDLNFYLQAYYKYRKSNQKDFSYETWSDELGFNKSRSFLRMIVIGKKKASPLFIEAFCGLSFQSALEKEYFLCLVKYSQAGTLTDKQAYGNNLVQILKKSTTLQQIENTDFVSSPLLPRLLTLISFHDIEPQAPTYARLLNLPLPQVEEALSTLRSLELIESFVKDGRLQWRALSERFKVPDHKGNLNLMAFHEKSLREAIAAFDKPKSLRQYKSLLLAMSEEELELFYRNLNDFAAEQLARFTPNQFSGRRVFQVNFNSYPVAGDES